MNRLSLKKKLIFLLLLNFSVVRISAYEALDLPIDRDMSRADVERVLGRPGFLIYTGMALQGIGEKLEVCMAGYRVPPKNGSAKLITVIFFQDNIQLAVSAYYEKKFKDKLMAKILKKNPQLKKISVRRDGVQGYWDHRTLDFYLTEKEDNTSVFPPRDLTEYLQAEEFLNDAAVQSVIDIVKQSASPKHTDLHGITYMNLRLIAGVASQPK